MMILTGWLGISVGFVLGALWCSATRKPRWHARERSAWDHPAQLAFGFTQHPPDVASVVALSQRAVR